MIKTKVTKTKGTVYEVLLRDPNGREYSQTFPTKKAARDYEADQRTARNRGTFIDPRTMKVTFAKIANEWLAANPAKRSSSYARDETIMRRHLLPTLGKRRVRSIQPKDVQGLVNNWAESHAPRTVRRHFDSLRAILNFAVNADVIARSPCRGVKLPKVTEREIHIVTAKELAELGAALGPEFELMVYMGAVLGLRWGECAGLRVGRLDFLRGSVSVVEQLTRGVKGVRVVAPPKSDAGNRTMAMPPKLVEMIATHLSRKGLTGADTDAYLFPSSDGQPLEYSNWRRREWLPAVKEAKLAGLTFHNLRAANATGMVAEGVDLKTAQTRLGHSDPRLTLAVYAKATDAGDRRAADKLGQRFVV